MIEKGIPIPELTRGRPLQTRWDLMEVGDSRVVGRLSTAESGLAWGKRRGLQVLTRKLKEPPYGWRVWRKA